MSIHLITESTIQSGNAASLIISGIVTFVLAIAYRKSSLTHHSDRILFAQAILATICMFTYATTFLYHPVPHDLLFILCSLVSYISIYIVEYMFVCYIVTVADDQCRGPVSSGITISSLAFCIISALLWSLSAFDQLKLFPESSFATYDTLFWIAHAGEWFISIMSLWLIFKYYDQLGGQRSMILVFMPALLILATLIEPSAKGLAVRYPAVMICMLIIYTQYHFKVKGASRIGEDAGFNSRLILGLGRLKPHYVGNVLSTIYYLFDMDPGQAQNSIGVFSEYLRDSLEMINRDGLIPFSSEQRIIRNYLALEKLRFEDRLRIQYDLDVSDFKLPALSVQALVENSVKHGLAPRDGRGLVRIETRHLADGGVKIRVIDDGVGFDSEKTDVFAMKSDLYAIRERLRSEVGGSLEIDSEPDKITTATITLPPEK